MKTKWQYVGACSRPGHVIQTCKEQGALGWELCGIYQSEAPMDLSSNWPASVELIFKRPVTSREGNAK